MARRCSEMISHHRSRSGEDKVRDIVLPAMSPLVSLTLALGMDVFFSTGFVATVVAGVEV